MEGHEQVLARLPEEDEQYRQEAEGNDLFAELRVISMVVCCKILYLFVYLRLTIAGSAVKSNWQSPFPTYRQPTHKDGRKYREARMGLETIFGSGLFTSKLNKIINWGRKYSFFPFPFVTACCGMEFMATWGSHYDVARFGAEFPRFSPRQSDLLMVVGTINHKIAPILKRVYDQMCEPKWVVAFGACASSGGFYRNYATVQGIDRVIPVDVYIAGCPPRPEAVLEGLMLLQNKVDTEDVLDRGKPLMVDGTVYSENRLVHVTPPVDTKADAVIDANHDPARHRWQGFK
jgi:NADH-quinone oxidoreductase subunit B